MPGPQPGGALLALGALARMALELAALGRQLALELRPPHGQRPLRGRRPALIDQPLRAALLLARLRAQALRLAQPQLGPLARLLRRTHPL